MVDQQPKLHKKIPLLVRRFVSDYSAVRGMNASYRGISLGCQHFAAPKCCDRTRWAKIRGCSLMCMIVRALQAPALRKWSELADGAELQASELLVG